MKVREANKTLRSLDSSLAIRRTMDGEYRVSVGNNEASAYYTKDLQDALNTGYAMATVLEEDLETLVQRAKQAWMEA